ncbi:5'-methylthioadenosine/adenosylhomocysteine nucleosidase [Paenibacillus sp. DXFW5]|uniref:adenosylhomocysteine nucleosidase n=1 Tax=Paenibacillus rhizolycopersici TaxID=2780073 RepID=A0ABS2HDC8_9BACL|nr:5'-methylthioadenosine/adenosylhomocysteine nucleosidase [Paenibacillus rhizolycopersici]MBM6998413.1 5'-methylthioadenosine/adenosylhomocysteine nucleosidase [Paenibacillus rhizolycopersici]
MNQTIGLMGAMDEEIALLLEKVKHQEAVDAAGATFVKGVLHGRNVVVCKSGVGKVNAATTTQILIDRFGAETVWFTGVAGAVHPNLNVGDIVISSTCLQHDMDVRPLGYKRGITPYQDVSDFPADPALIRLAEDACARQCTDHHYRVGRVLSGDQFIADPEFVGSVLYKELDGVCVEMEGAALAQVCHRNGVPFIVLRSISDKADGSADVNFTEFTALAARRSFAILNDMVEHAGELK